MQQDLVQCKNPPRLWVIAAVYVRVKRKVCLPRLLVPALTSWWLLSELRYRTLGVNRFVGTTSMYSTWNCRLQLGTPRNPYCGSSTRNCSMAKLAILRTHASAWISPRQAVGMFFKLLLIHWLLALYRVSGYTLSEIHGAKKITTHLPNYKVILPSLQQAASVDESSDAGLFGSIG